MKTGPKLVLGFAEGAVFAKQGWRKTLSSSRMCDNQVFSDRYEGSCYLAAYSLERKDCYRRKWTCPTAVRNGSKVPFHGIRGQ